MFVKYTIEHKHDLDYLTSYDDDFIGFFDKIEDEFMFIFELFIAFISDFCVFPLELFYILYRKWRDKK